MPDTTILVIDDSATIRRFVDTTLSPAGYRVILAPNAEEGIEQAQKVRPDAILLDHQLPGTTGLQVCEALNTLPDVRLIPVVVSSTLRKKAYIEYTDLPNVVDMLPKPYTAELLITTISNALETGKLIVQSQTNGTAVPEVIDAVEDADFSGTFARFSLREVLDFLNNGRKNGILEVELSGGRLKIYLSQGKVQAVSGTGFDTSAILLTIPDTLKELSPVLKLTISGRMCAELDGLVELLDRKVLDARLLKSLLRFQAAQLLWMAFHSPGRSFTFRARLNAPSLYRKLPLEISLTALLVEGAMTSPPQEAGESADDTVYIRAEPKGQNVDRTGLSARHLKVLAAIGEASTAAQLAAQLGWEIDEIRRVLDAFTLAELVEARTGGRRLQVVAVETNLDAAKVLQQTFDTLQDQYSSKIIRDRVALQILLKRGCPDVMLIGADTLEECQFMAKLKQHFQHRQAHVRLIGLRNSDAQAVDPKLLSNCDAVLKRPYTPQQIIQALGTTEAAAPRTSPRELAGSVG